MSDTMREPQFDRGAAERMRTFYELFNLHFSAVVFETTQETVDAIAAACGVKAPTLRPEAVQRRQPKIIAGAGGGEGGVRIGDNVSVNIPPGTDPAAVGRELAEAATKGRS